MNLLLDTHILLWWLADEPRLGQSIRESIVNPSTRVMISTASVWEIGIKQALGKLEVPESILPVIQDEGFEELPITGLHAELAARLPNHHRDPFDRMLIAQALLEELILVTNDKQIENYDLHLIKP
ncbi:MAG: type II toxin-antitoxin system VapC family toxin [Chromatiales bacterium]|jgi:PIN domain nuclease of toxin-antitoxin system